MASKKNFSSYWAGKLSVAEIAVGVD